MKNKNKKISVKNKTILVTGGAGFIGSYVSKKLAELGARVIIVDNFNNYYNPDFKRRRINNLLSRKKIKVYKNDIVDYQKIKKIFKANKIDIICHLAAQAGVRYSLKNPFSYEEINIRGTLNLLELAKDFKIKGFIMASSSSVYGKNKKMPFKESDKTDSPASLYAATKKAGELLAYYYHTTYKIPMTCLRFFTVYGPWGRPDMAYFKFTEKISREKVIEVYNYGKMKRDFTYIDDIVDGVIRAIQKNYYWRVFNLGFGRPIKLGGFIGLLEKYLGKKAKIKHLPMQKADVQATYADISNAKKMLNWQPKISAEKGLKIFIDWYKLFYNS